MQRDDAASLEIDSGFDPEEVLPQEHFPDEQISGGRLVDVLRTKTDILAAGLRMGERLTQLIADTASREYNGGSRLETVLSIYWGASAVFFDGNDRGNSQIGACGLTHETRTIRLKPRPVERGWYLPLSVSFRDGV